MDEMLAATENRQILIDYKNKIDALIHQQYHLQAQKHGLSLEQYHLLIELDELMLDVPAEEPGLSIGSIAEHIGNAQNTISERISRLENKGLVQRCRDAKDRRINRVLITAEGQKIIDAIDRETASSLLVDALGVLNDAEVNEMLNMLKKVLSQMEKKVK